MVSLWKHKTQDWPQAGLPGSVPIRGSREWWQNIQHWVSLGEEEAFFILSIKLGTEQVSHSSS